MRQNIQPLISEITQSKDQTLSFEFFPPKESNGLEGLYRVVSELKTYSPDFCSVTWGAGGSTVGQSLQAVKEINGTIGVNTIAHFTGLGMTPQTVEETLKRLTEDGIRNVLVLRGDKPHQTDAAKEAAGSFRYAADLVHFIRSREAYSSKRLGILVAGCPEGHPESKSFDEDMDHLTSKASMGVDAIITQFFLDNSKFYRFAEALRNRNLSTPIIIGVMILTRAKSIEKMVELSGCSVPEEISAAIRKFEGDDRSMEAFGIDYACRQLQDLKRNGFHRFHFYTLNRTGPVGQVLQKTNPNKPRT